MGGEVQVGHEEKILHQSVVEQASQAPSCWNSSVCMVLSDVRSAFWVVLSGAGFGLDDP